MATIIALRGIGNSGKSTTIRILYTLMLENDFELVESNYDSHRGDFIAILKKNKKLIGITSVGNTYDYVHERLQELISANCTICVCACRTFDRFGHGTNHAIGEFTNYRCEFIDKTSNTNPATRLVSDTNYANDLLNAINRLVR